MILKKRGATNVVATMLIFGIMIASIGVLYGQITPTLLGYETNSTTTNQNFIFETISQRYLQLSSSSEGSVSLVHIVSEQTEFDIETSTQLNFALLEDTNPIPAIPAQSVNISSFLSTVSGSFQPRSLSIENRVLDSDIYMNNNTNDASYILSSEYDYSEGVFSVYFRSRIDVYQIDSINWKMTITILQIQYIPSIDGTPAAFPVSFPEWTLRMRRQTSTVTSFVYTVGGSISLTHDLNGVSGGVYNFPGIQSGHVIEVDIIEIPVLFGI